LVIKILFSHQALIIYSKPQEISNLKDNMDKVRQAQRNSAEESMAQEESHHAEILSLQNGKRKTSSRSNL
jgi:hypothetical protein